MALASTAPRTTCDEVISRRPVRSASHHERHACPALALALTADGVCSCPARSSTSSSSTSSISAAEMTGGADGSDAETTSSTRQTPTLTQPVSAYPPTAISGAAASVANAIPASDSVVPSPITRAYRCRAPTAASSSYASAWKVPDDSAPDRPHRTNPAANPPNEGNSTQHENAAAYTTAARQSRPRRDTVSAQAPDGTSSTMPTADHSTSSNEIWAVLSPASANSSAYTGKTGMHSSTACHASSRRSRPREVDRSGGSAMGQGPWPWVLMASRWPHSATASSTFSSRGLTTSVSSVPRPPVARDAVQVVLRARTARTLDVLDERVSVCRACPRLVAWREEVATVKRRAFADQTYWGRPAPGFGDPEAHLLVLGLAPAAHGANRTGRVFTGDRSGDWLFAALHRAGYANQPTSTHLDDGLALTGARVVAAVRCAPPANAPTPDERDTCAPWLDREVQLLPGLRVVLALGGFAWGAALDLARRRGWQVPRPQPRFGHAAVAVLERPGGEPVHLVGSFHVSQQNTFTGRLTEQMLDDVLTTARRLATT